MKESSATAGSPKNGQVESWSDTSFPLTLPSCRVDVWKVRLDGPLRETLENADLFSDALSSDEIARADRFRFAEDRSRFIRCRATLRTLLGGYLMIPSKEVCFEYLQNGKPQLTAGQNPNRLQFNVSHSGETALIAVGCEQRLGIDIEKIRGDVDIGALAERFFSLRERAGLSSLSSHLRLSGFYACWTRKESFLKATGDGLSFPLADFSITTHPSVNPELEELKGDADAAKRWSLADLGGIEGHRAAIAVEGPQPPLEAYVWN